MYYIDSHVHCRDGTQSHKETIQHALKVAENSGIVAVFDMPNTDPPILTRNDVIHRLELAERADSPVFYGLYIGLTSNPPQIIEAVDVHNEFFPKSKNLRGLGDNGVVGLKLFAGKSVGDLSVVDKEEQRLVYKTLADKGYEGVLAVHCEKESLMQQEQWDPNRPITHCDARPPESETESVYDNISLAINTGFKGQLHILHISVPESVRLVNNYNKKVKISCSTTFHHSLLDNRVMNLRNGILWKVNPPIREKDYSSLILLYLRNGLIDYIETDHAPHTFEEKTKDPYMSGLPVLPFYPILIEKLRDGDFNKERIEDITCRTIAKIFRLEDLVRELQKRDLKVGENDYSKDYAFNPFDL